MRATASAGCRGATPCRARPRRAARRRALGDGYGHVELVYDFAEGGDGDGWLHALFRYEHRASGHAAETSFGAHVFNTILTYRDEPQSYSGRPPGPVDAAVPAARRRSRYDTLCHLIYPASTPWHAKSATDLILHDRVGREVARERIWRSRAPARASGATTKCSTTNARRARATAPIVVIRDPTCRLFGYHGLIGRGGAFSLDHMFGF